MKGIVVQILIGIALFSAGIAVGVPICRLYDKTHTSVEASIPAGTGSSVSNKNGGILDNGLQLRVRDGNLEWYDGVRWNNAGTVNELVAADPIARPSEEWQALAAQIAETRAREYAAEMETLSRDGGSLLVDEVAAAQSQTAASTASPRPTVPAAIQPTVPAVAPPTTSVNSVPDDNDNDNDDSHDEAPAPAPEPEPAPEPSPEPDDTGDGENIEWSGDYE